MSARPIRSPDAELPDFLRALESATGRKARKSGDEYRMPCPAHGGALKDYNLSVRAGDSRIVAVCFSPRVRVPHGSGRHRLPLGKRCRSSFPISPLIFGETGNEYALAFDPEIPVESDAFPISTPKGRENGKGNEFQGRRGGSRTAGGCDMDLLPRRRDADALRGPMGRTGREGCPPTVDERRAQGFPGAAPPLHAPGARGARGRGLARGRR